MRSLAPARARPGNHSLHPEDEAGSATKPSLSDELPTPEALQQSVASGARFLIQHLPPLEASLPSLTIKPPPAAGDFCDELPDLSAAAVSLETAHDVSTKPHISFACLIAMAILDSPTQKLTVSEIYEWMKMRYPYFASPAAGLGWKNSVRHNLSLNRHFMKKAREDDEAGKGAAWAIRPDSLPQLAAAVARQAKIYQRFGGGLAVLASTAAPTEESWAVGEQAWRRPNPAPARVRRQERDIHSDAAAAALLSLTHSALPAVKGHAGRPRLTAGLHATMRYYPDGQRPVPSPARLAGSAPPRDNSEVSPVPCSDEGIGATPDVAPRKRSNSGNMVYTFTAPLSLPDSAMRVSAEGRRSPPHARRRLALRHDSLDEEPADDALSVSATLLSLAAMQPLETSEERMVCSSQEV